MSRAIYAKMSVSPNIYSFALEHPDLHKYQILLLLKLQVYRHLVFPKLTHKLQKLIIKVVHETSMNSKITVHVAFYNVTFLSKL